MNLLKKLNVKELEICNLISKGYSNLDIASELIISIKTVENHVTNIYRKVNFELFKGGSNRVKLALQYIDEVTNPSKVIININGNCQYYWRDCNNKATTIACEDKSGSKPGLYCETHSKLIYEYGTPEYISKCPNCGCITGVG